MYSSDRNLVWLAVHDCCKVCILCLQLQRGLNSVDVLLCGTYCWKHGIDRSVPELRISNSLLLEWAKTGFQLACGHPVVKCTIADKHRLHMGQILEFSVTCWTMLCLISHNPITDLHRREAHVKRIKIVCSFWSMSSTGPDPGTLDITFVATCVFLRFGIRLGTWIWTESL
jgi:hypothetical protein